MQQRCRQLTGEIVAFDHELKRLVATLTPTLLVLVGCASLTAAKLLGETAAVDRFRSKRAYARYSGTTPPPVWTGNRLAIASAGRLRDGRKFSNP